MPTTAEQGGSRWIKWLLASVWFLIAVATVGLVLLWVKVVMEAFHGRRERGQIKSELD